MARQRSYRRPADTGLNKLATPFGTAIVKAITGGVGKDLRTELDRR